MNFWEAYQKMSKGEWCQVAGTNSPYRYANNRWETVSTEAVGQGVNVPYTLCTGEVTYSDKHDYEAFIVPVDYHDSYYQFYFGFDSLDAEWEQVNVTCPRIEDRPALTPSPEKAAREEKNRREREEYNRLHPPVIVSLTKEDVFRDRTSEFMESIRSFAFGTG